MYIDALYFTTFRLLNKTAAHAIVKLGRARAISPRAKEEFSAPLSLPCSFRYFVLLSWILTLYCCLFVDVFLPALIIACFWITLLSCPFMDITVLTTNCFNTSLHLDIHRPTQSLLHYTLRVSKTWANFHFWVKMKIIIKI